MENNMNEFPGVIDGEILEEMESLEFIIEFHKKVIEMGKNVENFIPTEVSDLLDSESLKVHWSNQNYDTIRVLYAKAWILYYENIFGDKTFYSLQHFSEIYKID